MSPRPGEGGAFCDCCGGRLGAVGLSDDERLRVRSALKSLAAESLLHGQAGGGAAAAVDPAEEGSEGNGGAREREEVVEETERSEVVEGLGDRPRKRGRPVALTAPIGGLDHFAGWLEERQREVGYRKLPNGTIFIVRRIRYYYSKRRFFNSLQCQ